MANDAGDMKLLGNFSKLIELISNNPDYNPANSPMSRSAGLILHNAGLIFHGAG